MVCEPHICAMLFHEKPDHVGGNVFSLKSLHNELLFAEKHLTSLVMSWRLQGSSCILGIVLRWSQNGKDCVADDD